MMGEGWVDRCEPTSVTRGVYCHEAMTDVLWGILGGVLKNGYKLDRRKGSETLFHTESTARVCKGVGIERAWPPGHGVERAWLSYRLRTLTQVVYWLGRWRRVEARLRKLLYAKEHFCWDHRALLKALYDSELSMTMYKSSSLIEPIGLLLYWWSKSVYISVFMGQKNRTNSVCVCVCVCVVCVCGVWGVYVCVCVCVCILRNWLTWFVIMEAGKFKICRVSQ